MTSLDDLEKIKQLDKQNVYGSIENLPKQCLHAWEDASKMSLPKEYQNIKQVIIAGMGGSLLGGRFINSVYGLKIKVPLVLVNGYDLPNWVNENTLIICSSYSGTTEETVSCAKQAIQKRAKWTAICTGGTLSELAEKQSVPIYKINPVYNPSHQPRMAIGYSIANQLAIVSQLGLISLKKENLQQAIKTMEKIIAECRVQKPFETNPAKKMAKQIFQNQVIFVASGHLTGALHTVKNQMNENAKNLAHRHDIPELNHHLMEGLQFPESIHHNTIFFFALSNRYPPRIQQRFQITQAVVKKNHVPLITWQPESQTKLGQAFELIQFGAFVNFYLTALHQIDPAPIPWVDYFKTQLGQPLGKE
jgi:glucose/mannose-6-phosphate isomerase